MKKQLLLLATALLWIAGATIYAGNFIQRSRTNANQATLSLKNGIIVEENFSKFIDGSEDRPDDSNIADAYKSTISEDLTEIPGWKGGGVHQAGGCCYLKKYSIYGDWDGYIQTPTFNFEGNIRIMFRAKLNDATASKLCVWVRYGNEPSEMLEAGAVQLTREWAEYKIEVKVEPGKGFDQSQVKFIGEPQKFLSFFIDDIKIERYTEEAVEPATPEAHPYENYTGTSFTAKWNKSEGAQSYLVKLYSLEDPIGEKSTLLKEIPAEGESLEVKELDPTKDYGYTVSAKNGEKVSEPSKMILVNEILPTKSLTISDTTKTSFKANWIASPKKVFQSLNTSKEVTIENDGEYVILDENYGIIDDTYINNHSYIPDWYQSNDVKIENGIIKMTGEDYIYFPEIIFSEEKGSVDIMMEIKAANDADIVIEYNENEDTSPLVVDGEYKDGEFNVMKATVPFENNYLYASIYSDAGKPMEIKSVKISKNVIKGEKITFLRGVKTFISNKDTSYEFKDLDRGKYLTTVSFWRFAGYSSQRSSNNPVAVVNLKGINVGVQEIEADHPTLEIRGRLIICHKDQNVSVYNMNGQKVLSKFFKKGETLSIENLTGVFVVKGQNESIKMIR